MKLKVVLLALCSAYHISGSDGSDSSDAEALTESYYPNVWQHLNRLFVPANLVTLQATISTQTYTDENDVKTRRVNELRIDQRQNQTGYSKRQYFPLPTKSKSASSTDDSSTNDRLLFEPMVDPETLKVLITEHVHPDAQKTVTDIILVNIAGFMAGKQSLQNGTGHTFYTRHYPISHCILYPDQENQTLRHSIIAAISNILNARSEGVITSSNRERIYPDPTKNKWVKSLQIKEEDKQGIAISCDFALPYSNCELEDLQNTRQTARFNVISTEDLISLVAQSNINSTLGAFGAGRKKTVEEILLTQRTGCIMSARSAQDNTLHTIARIKYPSIHS